MVQTILPKRDGRQGKDNRKFLDRLETTLNEVSDDLHTMNHQDLSFYLGKMNASLGFQTQTLQEVLRCFDSTKV